MCLVLPKIISLCVKAPSVGLDEPGLYSIYSIVILQILSFTVLLLTLVILITDLVKILPPCECIGFVETNCLYPSPVIYVSELAVKIVGFLQ